MLLYMILYQTKKIALTGPSTSFVRAVPSFFLGSTEWCFVSAPNRSTDDVWDDRLRRNCDGLSCLTQKGPNISICMKAKHWLRGPLARVCVCMCMGAPLDIEGLLPCLRSLLPPRPARRSANNFGGALKKEKGLCF